MSFQAQKWAVGIKTTVMAKSVLMALAFRADDADQCWPSLALITEDTCMSERAARNAIGTLEDSGIICRRERNGTSTVYTLNVGFTPAPDAATPARRAPPAPDAPRQEMPPSPAPDAAPPRHVVPPPRHVVPPNNQEQSPESSVNNHRAREAELFIEDLPTSADERKPSPVSQKVPKRSSILMNGTLEAFEEWWRSYPRRIGKAAAEKSYANALKRGASKAELLLALRNQRWPDNPQYIPHPATWLNQGRWMDEAPASVENQPSAEIRAFLASVTGTPCAPNFDLDLTAEELHQ